MRFVLVFLMSFALSCLIGWVMWPEAPTKVKYIAPIVIAVVLTLWELLLFLRYKSKGGK